MEKEEEEDMMSPTESFPPSCTYSTYKYCCSYDDRENGGGKPSSLHLASRKMAVPRGGKKFGFSFDQFVGKRELLFAGLA